MHYTTFRTEKQGKLDWLTNAHIAKLYPIPDILLELDCLFVGKQQEKPWQRKVKYL